MKERVYRSRRWLKALPAVLCGILAALLLLAAVGFFLLRSWTEYDAAGAHISFPWSETGEAEQPPAERSN